MPSIVYNFQMKFFFGTSVLAYIACFLFSGFFEFPFQGIELAIVAKTKREVMKLGRNPLDDGDTPTSVPGLSNGNIPDTNDSPDNYDMAEPDTLTDSPSYPPLHWSISQTSQL